MKKILTVDPDAERSAALLESLGKLGFEAWSAEGCLHALTMLEWRRPDLILVRCEVTDMTPSEFCYTVKQDPLFNRVPTALIGSMAEGAAFDLQVEEATADRLATQVCELVWRGLDSPRDASGATATTRSDSHQKSAGQRRLRELIEVLTQAVRTGLLHVEIDRYLDPRFLLLDHGQIVHAEFGRLHGAMAFERILLESERVQPIRYRFEEMERWKITAYPRSIRHDERQRVLHSALDAEVSDSQATCEIDLNDWQQR